MGIRGAGGHEDEVQLGEWHRPQPGQLRWLRRPVGRFAANAFGLYEMHGNVREWVEDCWHENYRGAPADGRVWAGGDCTYRVVRGGSWGSSPQNLRFAKRFRNSPSVRYNSFGFRLIRELNP